MKKSNIKRSALFVRIKKTNKDYLIKETEKTKRVTNQWFTTQDFVDQLIAGVKRLKKQSPIVAAKYF
jgi:hypothetical protein